MSNKITAYKKGQRASRNFPRRFIGSRQIKNAKKQSASEQKNRNAWDKFNVGITTAATVFIAIAAIVTGVVGYYQWSALKSTDEATHSLAKAALEQAKAAGEQLSEMRIQSALTINQLRPKLTLSFNGPKEPMKVEGKEGWVFTPTWQNRGGSEGIDFWGWDNGRLFTPDAPQDFDFLTFKGDASAVSKVTIGINEPRLQYSKFISREDVQSIIENKGKFILWGYVEYRESLPGNQAHHIHWCYEAVPIDAGNSYIFAHPTYRAECNSSD